MPALKRSLSPHEIVDTLEEGELETVSVLPRKGPDWSAGWTQMVGCPTEQYNTVLTVVKASYTRIISLMDMMDA